MAEDVLGAAKDGNVKLFIMKVFIFKKIYQKSIKLKFWAVFGDLPTKEVGFVRNAYVSYLRTSVINKHHRAVFSSARGTRIHNKNP